MESPKRGLRFRDLRSKTLAFKKRIAIAFCDLKTSLGARACVRVLCVQKTRRFAFAFLSPLRSFFLLRLQHVPLIAFLSLVVWLRGWCWGSPWLPKWHVGLFFLRRILGSQCRFLRKLGEAPLK